MRIEKIEVIDKWNELRKMLLEFDYRIWQIPYFVYGTDELHALFKSDDAVIEVVTHNREVADAIKDYPNY